MSTQRTAQGALVGANLLLVRLARAAALLPLCAVATWGVSEYAGASFWGLPVAPANPWLVGALFISATVHLAVTTHLAAGKRDAPLRSAGLSFALTAIVAVLSDAVLCALFATLALGLAMVALAVSSGADVRSRASAEASRQDDVTAFSTVGYRVRAALMLLVPTSLLLLLIVALLSLELRVERASEDDEPGRARSAAVTHRGSRSSHLVVSPSATGGDEIWDSPEVILELTPTVLGEDQSSPGAAPGPRARLGSIYLRGVALDVVDGAGRWQEAAGPYLQMVDRADGNADGWCELLPRPARRDAVTFAIAAVTIVHEGAGQVLLHAPLGTAAVQLPQVDVTRGDGLLLPSNPHGLVEYTLYCGLPGRMAHPSDRTAALPPSGDALPVDANADMARALTALTGEAGRATDRASADLAVVHAICRHLRDQYKYAKISGGDSGRALSAFVSERRGSCVQFAQAAALMLRSRGLAARVATGFLVREWVPSRGCYVARGSDYHAWIEVNFRDIGWVTFDPTPMATEETNEQLDDTLPESGLNGEGGLSGLSKRVEQLAATAAAFIREHPLVWLLGAVAAQAAFIALRRLMRRRALRGARTAPGDLPSSRAWERLVDALARRGLHRGSNETATEFARRAAVAFEQLSLLPLLTARQQASRFGRIPLTADVEAEFDALARTLRASAP